MSAFSATYIMTQKTLHWSVGNNYNNQTYSGLTPRIKFPYTPYLPDTISGKRLT